MIPSSEARRTVASTCAEGMIATSIATGSHRSGVALEPGRGLTPREVWRAACHDRLRARTPPTLADAADPLGKLQRGLGSGYLWALDADRAVSHALLVHCVFNDPRWDRQLDDRDDYYATLALDIGLDLAPLEGVAARQPPRRTPRRRTTSSRCSGGWRSAATTRRGACCASTSPTASRGRARSRGSSATSMPAAPAVRRGRRSSRGSMPSCSSASPTHGRARRGARRDRPARAPVVAVVGREPGDRAGAGVRSRRLRARRRRSARGARASARSSRTRCTRSSCSRSRVLALGADRRGARDAHDALRRRAARRRRERAQPADAPRGDPRARPPGPARGARDRRGRTRRRPSAASCRARSRWRSRRCRCRRRARWRTTGWAPTTGRGGARRRACSRRGPRTRTSRPARSALSRELDRGLDGDVYVVCSLAEALGRCAVHGPFEELSRAYEEIPYSYGRRYVVSALAARRPDVRRRRRRRVPLGLRARGPPARGRARRPARPPRRPAPRELAADQAQAASVRRAARAAAGASTARRKPAGCGRPCDLLSC